MINRSVSCLPTTSSAAIPIVADIDLLSLKTDPLMDPLRKEPRFQAVMRELRFPD